MNQDFKKVIGQSFNHFFCPILFVDETTELCEAHIVNKAFSNSSRRWTLQRKDVDNFFGTMFEGAFVDLQFNKPGVAYKALTEPNLYQRLRPKIILNEVEVEHFVAKGQVPKDFPELQIELDQKKVRLGLKISKESLKSCPDLNLQFEVYQDLRVQAFVSMLKAAHLTMFELLGYTYALGQSGLWLGQLLGTFYQENSGKSKKEVLQKAIEYFSPFTAMVRPVLDAPSTITGTIDDRCVHLCWLKDTTNNIFWGIVVYVRTDDKLHAVLLPVLEHKADAIRFEQFLYTKGDIFEVSMAKYLDTHWAIEKERRTVKWPPAGFE